MLRRLWERLTPWPQLEVRCPYAGDTLVTRSLLGTLRCSACGRRLPHDSHPVRRSGR